MSYTHGTAVFKRIKGGKITLLKSQLSFRFLNGAIVL